MIQKDFEWLLKIIESCENNFHLECAERLIDFFNKKYSNSAFAWALKQAQARQWNKLNENIQ